MFWRDWSTCQVCRLWPTAMLCEDCRSRHAALLVRCPHCALTLQGHEAACANGFKWQRAAARVSYEHPMDGWVKRLKFAGDWALAADMGQLMRESAWAESLKRQADWIFPMPLGTQRLQARGYNQAAWLARMWCGKDVRLKLNWLVKTRETDAQAKLDRATRLAQLQGSMAVVNGHHPALKGSRVLLVDDVMTTGATLDVATRCVLAAGALSVDVAVFARTPANAPHP